MRHLLQALAKRRNPALVAREFDKAVGDAVVRTLLDAKILYPARAIAYRCAERYGEKCPRSIEENVGDTVHPYIARRPQKDSACGDVLLTAEDVAQYRASIPAFLELVRALLQVEGNVVFDDDAHPEVVQLGQLLTPNGPITDVFLAWSGTPWTISPLLANRCLIRDRNTLVLALTATHVPQEIMYRYSSNPHVQLRILEDMMVVKDGEIRLREAATFAAVALPETATQRDTEEQAGAAEYVVIRHDGTHRMSRSQYESLARDRATYDLIIDLTRRTNAGRVPTGYREKGQFHETELLVSGAEILAELMERRTELKAKELRSAGGIQAFPRMFERARQCVDIALSRYGWRMFHSHRGATPEEKLYSFRPPPGLRFVLVRGA